MGEEVKYALEDCPRNRTTPPARVGLYSALAAASGSADGRFVLANNGGDGVLANSVKVEMGFLEGASAKAHKTKLICGLKVPLTLALVLKQRARPALEGAALRAAISELHGEEAAEDAIQAALRKLDEEGGTRCAALTEALGREAKVRYGRDEMGRLVFALIDVI